MQTDCVAGFGVLAFQVQHGGAGVGVGDSHPAEAHTRLPAHQRAGDGAVQAHGGGIVLRGVDQRGHQAAVVAAHDAGADGGGDDVGDGLA